MWTRDQRYCTGCAFAILVGFFLLAIAISPPIDRSADNEIDKFPWWESSAVWTAIFTGVLSVSTIGLWLSTQGVLESAIEQGRQTERTAKALETVADGMTENVSRLRETVVINRGIADVNKQMGERQKSLGEAQLRAYVSVQIATNSTYQDRTNGIKFGAGALLVNTGATPAHRVRTRIKAALLPVPLPTPKDFELLVPSAVVDEDLIPPHSNRSTAFTLPDFCDDKLIQAVKRANGTGLYIWGIVTYEDEFQALHETKFCHLVTWLPPNPVNGIEQVYGYYISGRNTMVQLSGGNSAATDDNWD